MKRTSTSRTDATRNAIQFGRDPLGFLDRLKARSESDLTQAQFVVGPTLTFVTDPSLVREVLVKQDERYHRPDIQSGRTTQLTTSGLIESDGALWRAQRERLQPLFGRDQLTKYSDVIGTTVEQTKHRWEHGNQIDLYEEMTALTVQVITETLFSEKLKREETEQFIRANATIGDEFEISPVALLRQLLPTPPSSEYRQVVTEMHDWAEALIDRHRQMENPPNNLITTMLRAEQDPEADLPPNQVRDEVLTFLFAGHETTALTLAYALWFVSANPSIAAQVRTEARNVLAGERPSWQHLSELGYTERVIRETLRLRPPSWGIFRQAKLDSPLGDYRIRRGDFLMLPQWTLHRDPEYFENPQEFRPSRWGEIEPSRTDAYFPFGAGPHACIGGQLALTEAQLVLASLLTEFEFDVESKSIDDLRAAGVLQPKGGIQATIRGAPS
jgi:cytochrome P450